MKGDNDQAIAECTEAIRLDPDYAFAYRTRGDARYARADYEPAVADYAEVLRREPENVWVLVARGRAHARQKNREAAVKDFEEAIRLAPEDSAIYGGIAWFLATCPDAEARDGQLAVQYATKAVELKKDSDQLDTLAAAYAEIGDFDKAIQTQQQAIDDPTAATNESWSATLRGRLKQYQEKTPYREK